MKKIEMDRARLLRRKGYSMNEIVSKLKVAKSSVSLWVRDIELTYEQKKRISQKGRSLEAIEKRRIVRLTNERKRRSYFFKAAVDEVEDIHRRDLFMLGAALYWGEGSKTKRGTVNFTNSDPRSIQIMMRFFKEICSVPSEKFRGHVILHPHLDCHRAERYWRQISGIPLNQFQKTSMQHNKASQNKKDSLPFGTFAVAVYDTILYLRLMGWMDGIYKKIIINNRVPYKFHRFL